MKRMIALILVVTLIVAAVPLNSAATATNAALASYYRGDTDGDWSITTADARILLTATLTGADLIAYPRYDVNGDGALTTADARDVLIDTVTETPPTLISPTVTQVDTLPEGEDVEFVKALNINTLEMENVNIDLDIYDTEQLIIQSLHELQAVYENDWVYNYDYTTAYNEAFFQDNAIILIKVFLFSCPKTVYVKQLVQAEQTITIHVVEEYSHGVLPSLYASRILLEISKSELDDITDLQIYVEKDQPSFE